MIILPKYFLVINNELVTLKHCNVYTGLPKDHLFVIELKKKNSVVFFPFSMIHNEFSYIT